MTVKTFSRYFVNIIFYFSDGCSAAAETNGPTEETEEDQERRERRSRERAALSNETEVIKRSLSVHLLFVK